MEIFWFIVASLMGGLIGVVFFIYHLKRGQFEDVEDSKYQMFRDEE